MPNNEYCQLDYTSYLTAIPWCHITCMLEHVRKYYQSSNNYVLSITFSMCYEQCAKLKHHVIDLDIVQFMYISAPFLSDTYVSVTV